MRRTFLVVLLWVLCPVVAFSQEEWYLELSSTVGIRTFKLSNKVEKIEKELGGATIALYEGSTIVRQVRSDARGNFAIAVPANGEYILQVSYQDCNPKKFIISTKGVSAEFAGDDYKPTFSIGGVIMAKPLPGIDYSVLKQPLVRVAFMQKGKKFDDDEKYTDQILDRLSQLADSEKDLIERFVNSNKTGDGALAKNDCPLAKASYEKALSLIPGEWYPTEQLAKVGLCLKEKEQLAAAQKSAEVKPAAKEELVKTEKNLEVKVNESTAEKEKLAEAERAAKEKAAKEAEQKAEREKQLAAEAKKKAEEEKQLAAEAKRKAEEEKARKAKTESEKAAAAKAAADKAKQQEKVANESRKKAEPPAEVKTKSEPVPAKEKKEEPPPVASKAEPKKSPAAGPQIIKSGKTSAGDESGGRKKQKKGDSKYSIRPKL